MKRDIENASVWLVDKLAPRSWHGKRICGKIGTNADDTRKNSPFEIGMPRAKI